MSKLLTKIVVVVALGLFIGWYGYSSFQAWKAEIFLAGQNECRGAVKDATSTALQAEALKARDEATKQAQRAKAAEEALAEIKSVAKSEHQDIAAEAAEAAKAATQACPAPVISDKIIGILNAPLKPEKPIEPVKK